MKRLTKNIVISASSTMIDWIDFSIFALLIPILSKNFFPTQHPKHSYLLSLSLFSAAYLSRPLGGYFSGRISNRFSQESTLRLSTLAMGLCSFCIVSLPTFQRSGYMGACLFLIIRIIQGVIIGGQYPTAFIILSDESINRYPYLISNISSIFSYLGVILGQCFTREISNTIGAHGMMLWGWRVLFLLSGGLSITAYFIQKQIPIVHSKKDQITNKLTLKKIKNNFKNLIFLFLVIFLLGIEYFTTTVTIPNYFLINHFITLQQSILIKSTLSVSALLLSILFAFIADKFKLKYSLLVIPSFMISIICFLIPESPVNYHSSVFQYGYLELMILLYCASVAVIYPIITQLFSADSRNTFIGLGYGLANTSSVIVSTNLVSYLCLKKNTLTPDFIILLFSSLSFLFYFFTFHQKTSQPGVKI
jgi:MFS family permease